MQVLVSASCGDLYFKHANPPDGPLLLAWARVVPPHSLHHVRPPSALCKYRYHTACWVKLMLHRRTAVNYRRRVTWTLLRIPPYYRTAHPKRIETGRRLKVNNCLTTP